MKTLISTERSFSLGEHAELGHRVVVTVLKGTPLVEVRFDAFSGSLESARLFASALLSLCEETVSLKGATS